MKKYLSIAVLLIIFIAGLLLFLSGDESDTIGYLLIVKSSGFITIYIAIELFKGLSGLRDLREWLDNDADNVE